jgi:glucoamylase
MTKDSIAPGAPGKHSRWTSGGKLGIGKALNALSRVSFTLSQGIIDEIYFPREDIACIKSLELIVTNGKDFFSAEKEHTFHEVKMIDSVPAYKMTNTCYQKRYIIEKEIITDPLRNTFLLQIKFKPFVGKLSDYHLYLSVVPHLHNYGNDNIVYLGDYKGIQMLYAQRHSLFFALACSKLWKRTTVGYAGTSDGWQDLQKNKNLTKEYQKAGPGSVALLAEIDLENSSQEESVIIAIGFGFTSYEAGHNAHASLLDGFQSAKDCYIKEWQEWDQKIVEQYTQEIKGKYIKQSLMEIRLSESKGFPGAIIASLSIPWGPSRSSLGGYHIVWPRDLVESAGVFLALKAKEETVRILNYLMAIQESDGKWMQNTWLDGEPYEKATQMDQISLPMLLIDSCMNEKFINLERLNRYWPMIKNAAAFLISQGPFTQQGRWEEQHAGLSPYTIATQVAALLIIADLAEKMHDSALSQYCIEIADNWNENIENWCYVSGTQLADQVGVEGYYIRHNPTGEPLSRLKKKVINHTNYAGKNKKALLGEMVSVDALGLVRYGLRDAHDPRILNTIKVIDHVLKVETPRGPCWHRFNYDSYGEHADGSPYNGKGIGRLWPLLTGERAHYEIAAGHFKEAQSLLKAMESFAHEGLFPEQIWDSKDIPEKNLFFGKYTGSAMPLTWAHAEYIKLCLSLKKKRVIDMPYHTQERYIKHQQISPFAIWKIGYPFAYIPKGKKLRIEVMNSATIYWSNDQWKTQQRMETRHLLSYLHFADIPCQHLQGRIAFKIFGKNSQKFENQIFELEIK